MRGTRFRDTLHGGGGFATPDVFQPLAGNDFVLGGSAITFVDMGAAPDGADKVLGLQGTIVSYAKRTNPIRAAVDLGGADDGEPGERDELLQVGSVIGGSAGDTMLTRENRIDGVGIGFEGGPGATPSGHRRPRPPQGRAGTDPLRALAATISCASRQRAEGCSAAPASIGDDDVEATVSDCETRTAVGRCA